MLKFKCKQGANIFCGNYQTLEMYCSLPAPKTLLGDPAVLITLGAALPGPGILFQDKGSSSVFVLVFHQHLKPNSARFSPDSMFCLKARRNKKQKNVSFSINILDKS